MYNYVGDFIITSRVLCKKEGSLVFEKLTASGKLLEKALDATWVREEVIVQNIANVDTPRYKRKTVAFEKYLSQAMDDSSFKLLTTDRRHIGSEDAVDEAALRDETDTTSLSTRLDGNNVDIENEMASLAKNTIKYNVLIQSINGGFNRLKHVISEGRR